jgi:hypothetical protein
LRRTVGKYDETRRGRKVKIERTYDKNLLLLRRQIPRGYEKDYYGT